MHIQLPSNYLFLKANIATSISLIFIGIVTTYFSLKIGLILMSVVWLGVMGLLHDMNKRLKALIYYMEQRPGYKEFGALPDIDPRSFKYEIFIETLNYLKIKTGLTNLLKIIVFVLAMINLVWVLKLYDAPTWLRLLLYFLSAILYSPISSKLHFQRDVEPVLPTMSYLTRTFND